MQQKTHKLASRLSYTFGAFGHDMFYATLSTYFVMFITSHLFDKSNGGTGAKMITYITIIMTSLRIVELVIDPFIGNTIDNTNTRWGHFKPWIVFGGTLGSIILAALFTDLGGLNVSNPWLYLILFAILYITMDIFYSFKDIGFWSMIPALSFDSNEREKIATFARVGSNIGQNIVGVIVMPLVLFFSVNANHGQGDKRGWFAFAAIVALIAWISAMVVAAGTKEIDSDLRKNKEKTTFRGVLGVLVHNDQLMWLALTYGIYTTGMAITNSLELYYFTYILGKPAEFSFLASLNAVIGVFAVLAFPPLAQKFKRKNVFFISISIMFLALLLFAFSGKSLFMVLFSAVLFYIPQPLVFLVVLMILTDSVEYGQLKLGHRDESLTLSVRPLLDKLGGAVSNGVVVLTAIIAGMTSGASASDITPSGQLAFKFMMFGIPAVMFLIASILFSKKIKLDEKAHAEIVDELEKTWGQHLGTDDSADTESEAQVIDYKAPIDGELIDLANVNDERFASGEMGKGFAIKPTDGKVYAPFSGTVEVVFPTRHAVGLKSDNGVVTLIHVGIDTVTMRGTGFISYVKQGQRVEQGDMLLEFWAPAIEKAGLDDTVLLVISNSDEVHNIEFKQASGKVTHGDDVLNITK
ncbi:PTS sugar transporter subunit IIA [Lentilactobacillus curieae]|uniref:PTS sugar transporter subunit IIA n=1 Tax=Lentilactobacillus curieae TaxID=1138822 RepID=A0A1S6QHR1_9LACO|nr:glycoside-pentoside-hexuronide (GPH):cation symporter [Lentilactobacillus curieae]AQW21129.1 PTS sugar transporter subunit IIA [Lentilactobacillus curieae]